MSPPSHALQTVLCFSAWKVRMAKDDMKSTHVNGPGAAEEARLDAAADAEIEAAQFAAHDKVVAWLRSWGTSNELLCPEPVSR